MPPILAPARAEKAGSSWRNINPTFDWLSVDKDRNQLMSHAPEDPEIHAKEQSIYTTGILQELGRTQIQLQRSDV